MYRFSILFLLLMATLLTGCGYNAQLIKLASPNLQTTVRGLVLENDTLTLTFDFYRERGLMHLKVFNKLNVPLYIDWKQSA